MEPMSHVRRLNGPHPQVLEWAPSADGAAAVAVLVHGFQSSAATWERVATLLARKGFRVLAPDMRGFGDGPRAPQGSYYYFPDYVADLAAILRSDASATPVFLVGHSMGATIVSYYAGAFPERVAKLAL